MLHPEVCYLRHPQDQKAVTGIGQGDRRSACIRLAVGLLATYSSTASLGRNHNRGTWTCRTMRRPGTRDAVRVSPRGTPRRYPQAHHTTERIEPKGGTRLNLDAIDCCLSVLYPVRAHDSPRERLPEEQLKTAVHTSETRYIERG